MFVLAELKDTIRIPPEMFNLKLVDAVKDEINRKLANKVEELVFGYTFLERLKTKLLNSIQGSTQCWPMHCVKRYHKTGRRYYSTRRWRCITFGSAF